MRGVTLTFMVCEICGALIGANSQPNTGVVIDNVELHRLWHIQLSGGQP